MPESLLALVLLACPVGMGLMMWMMRRDDARPTDPEAAAKEAELTRLRAEIDHLRAERNRSRPGVPGRSSS